MTEIIQTDTILEAKNFIVLEKYTKLEKPSTYQTEADLERELVSDLRQQGYERRKTDGRKRATHVHVNV